MRLALVLLALVGCEKAGTPPDRAPVPVSEPIKSSEDGVRQKLFAADVPTDALPLSIAIETIGGVSTILIPRGTKLPTSLTETFSTGADDQQSVEVHILQGERPMVKDNRSLGRFQLTGIPQAPRGVPQIEVTFEIDASGVLSVRARDRATNARKEIRIEGGLTGALVDKATLDKVLADADAARADDARRSAWSAARIELDSLVYSTRKLLADPNLKPSAAARKTVEQALSRADAAYVASSSPGDPALVLKAKDVLQKAVVAMTEELYQNAE
jgi:molecular chaperone DnaK